MDLNEQQKHKLTIVSDLVWYASKDLLNLPRESNAMSEMEFIAEIEAINGQLDKVKADLLAVAVDAFKGEKLPEYDFYRQLTGAVKSAYLQGYEDRMREEEEK